MSGARSPPVSSGPPSVWDTAQGAVTVSLALLAPGVAVVGNLCVGYRDREAQRPEVFPPAQTTRAAPTTGATAIMTPWRSAAVTPLSWAAPALAR